MAPPPPMALETLTLVNYREKLKNLSLSLSLSLKRRIRIEEDEKLVCMKVGKLFIGYGTRGQNSNLLVFILLIWTVYI
jgi:hypothetical protein